MAAAILYLRYLHQILQEDASRPCGDDHAAKSRNWKLICVTSLNERLKHLNNHCVYFYPIWYRTQMPHYQHVGWPNSHNLKIQDGGGRHLEFRKIVNNSGLDKDICTKFYVKMHHGHVTKRRNRKLIPVTSSNERLKRKCVDLSYYNI